MRIKSFPRPSYFENLTRSSPDDVVDDDMSDVFSTVANKDDGDDDVDRLEDVDGEVLVAGVDVTQAFVVDTTALAAKKKPIAAQNDNDCDDEDDVDWWFIFYLKKKVRRHGEKLLLSRWLLVSWLFGGGFVTVCIGERELTGDFCVFQTCSLSGF